MTMLDHAQAYAGRGWHVFPIKARGKKPLTNHGMNAATTNSEIIKRWWERWPDANIGLNCAASGIVVIDVDPRNGGSETWADYIQKNLLIDNARSNVEALSGGGGEHHLYLAPADATFKAELGQGVDIKHRGYILLAPSIHPNGNPYVWVRGEHEEPRELPEWMLADMTREAVAPQEFTGEPVDDETWELLTEAIEHTDVKEKREQWIRQGMQLHSTGRSDAALELWDERSQLTAKYDREELERDWSTFKDEKKTGVVTYKSIFHEAEENGWKHPGGSTRWTDDPEEAFRDCQPLPEEPPTAETPAETPPKKKRRFKVKYYRDMTTGMHDPQLIQNLIMGKSLNVIYGPSGAGKTFVAQRLALDVAGGKPFFDRLTTATTVAYVAAEAFASAERRFGAAREQRGINLDRLDSLYAIYGFVDLRKEEAVMDLIETLKEHPRPGLVVIDTLAAAWPGIEENTSEGMGTAIGGMSWIRDAFDCAVIVVHHSGKDITSGARGHSSLRAAVDTELQVVAAGDQIKVEVRKFRDGRIGDTFFGQLENIDLGTDQWDETARTAILTPCGSQADAAKAFSSKATPKGANQMILWEALKEIWLGENGAEPIPVAVAYDIGRSKFPQGASGRNSAEKVTEQAVTRTLQALLATGWIDRDKDLITSVKP